MEGEGQVKPAQVLKFELMALDRKTGKVLWQRTTREQGPHEGTHGANTWASASPVTDGEHVYAYFGSFGLYCLDMKGNPVWEKDLGDMTVRLKFGEGSSPLLYGDKLVIIWDHQGDSFIVAWTSARETNCGESPGRGDFLVEPHRGRARRPETGGHQRHQPGAQLRPGDRRPALGR